MTKEQLLEILKLLSALESWGFANKQYLPDFLCDRLCRQIDLISEEILK